MKKEKILTGILTAAFLAAALTGCGKEDAQTGKEAAGTQNQEAAASDGKQVIKAVVPSVDKPLAFVDEDGNITGYEYEVMVAVNELLENYTLEFTATDEQSIDLLMESGDAIVSTGGYYWNENRAEKFLIPENPIGASSLTLYIRAEDAEKIGSLADVASGGYKLVPVGPNGGAYNALASWNEQNGNALGEIATREGFGSADSLSEVAAGKYDAYVVPNNYGVTDVITELGLDIVAAKEPIFTKKTVVLVNKEYPELADEINTALGKLREDGTLAKISTKWYGSDLLTLLDGAE